MKLWVSAYSDKGMRRDNNEDMAMVHDTMVCDDESIQKVIDGEVDGSTVMAVADGMGGCNAGEVASQITIEHLLEWREKIPKEATAKELLAAIDDEVKLINADVCQCASTHAEYEGMGSTMVGMVCTLKACVVFNVGDSRLYRFRDGWLRQITRDHSLRNLTKDFTVPSNIIYNSIGVKESVFADKFDLTGKIKEGDAFLICSDGLSDMLDDDKIEELLKNDATPQTIIKAVNDAGGKDNVTAVLIKVASL